MLAVQKLLKCGHISKIGRISLTKEVHGLFSIALGTQKSLSNKAAILVSVVNPHDNLDPVVKSASSP